ncbi:MAG: AtpZ/AtpI family protein [Candidatus Heimdallarchaeota archaeon]
MAKRETSAEGTGRYFALASEMVVLTLVGLFLGQALGQKLGAPFDTLGIIVGAMLGFILGVYTIYKTIERLDKKTVVKIGKNLCPECLRGIPIDLEECPHCGYRR